MILIISQIDLCLVYKISSQYHMLTQYKTLILFFCIQPVKSLFCIHLVIIMVFSLIFINPLDAFHKEVFFFNIQLDTFSFLI